MISRSHTYKLRALLFLLLFVGNGMLSSVLLANGKVTVASKELEKKKEKGEKKERSDQTFSQAPNELLPQLVKLFPVKEYNLVEEVAPITSTLEGEVCSRTVLEYSYFLKIFHGCIKINAP